MPGKTSIDQMVEAAIWMMVQGDRADAEELLTQVLRLDPVHEGAREAMKTLGASTTPGQQPPSPREVDQTILRVPAVRPREATPAEPLPRHEAALTIADELPDRAPDVTIPGRDIPFSSTPSSVMADKPTMRLPTVQAPLLEPAVSTSDSGTHPSVQVPEAPEPPAEPTRVVELPPAVWTLEVLTGPHTGKTLAVGKRPMLIGKGLGALDVEADPFMSNAHASFFLRGGDLWISDGGSASGSWLSIDGAQRLNPGDSFSVGLQRLKYLGPLDSPPAGSVEYGGPRPADGWRLEQVLLGARAGRTWIFSGAVSVGRGDTQLSFADDDTQAALHAELHPAGEALEVVDKSGPESSTFVALNTGGERRLKHHMRVRLGGTLFRVSAR